MYSITKNGVAVDPELYTIDEVNKTFASRENGLVIDFTGEGGWIFRINHNCTITTGDGCFINADFNCNITTGHNCFINTGSGCNIIANDGCTIDAGYTCHISTGHNAVIRAYGNSDITSGENCVVIRHDTNEVIKLVERQTIRLNSRYIEGYEVIKPIETIEIGGLKFNKEEVTNLLKTIKPIN